MGDIHIYSARFQPATHWIDRCGAEPMEFKNAPGKLMYCQCCSKRRPARNCVVQAYYDGLMVWCADGKGCKDPRVIKAKRRLEFSNRSAGQKRRWADKLAKAIGDGV